MEGLRELSLNGTSIKELSPWIERLTGLEDLDLSGSKIEELPSSINNLTGLSCLGLDDCKELKCLPSSIRMKSLKFLNLFGCSSLEMFPEISEVIEGLKELDLSGSKIKELPSSINNLTGLSHLNLDYCKELKNLPSSICQLKSLVSLSLSGCTKFEVFPSIEENMEGLRNAFIGWNIYQRAFPLDWTPYGASVFKSEKLQKTCTSSWLCNMARLITETYLPWPGSLSTANPPISR